MSWTKDRKEILASDTWKKAPAKKDKKHFCGGKPGRFHKPEIVRRNENYALGKACSTAPEWKRVLFGSNWYCYHQEICSRCGKILRHYITEQECPDRASVAQR